MNAYSCTQLRIQNNTRYGVVMQVFSYCCLGALPSSTTLSGNGQDIAATNSSEVITSGCALPSGCSPARGVTGNTGSIIY